jgi:hypothetical protein
VLDLQQTLIKKLKILFDGQQFQKQRDNDDETAEYVPLNLYSQALPYTNGDDGCNYAPYIAVQIQSSKQEDETEPQDTIILLNIGIYDDDKMNQGYISVLNIIETIRQCLFLKRLFDGKYYIKLPFSWQLSDEDVWPFFVGSIETHWNLPLTIPDDPNL